MSKIFNVNYQVELEVEHDEEKILGIFLNGQDISSALKKSQQLYLLNEAIEALELAVD